MNEEKRNVKQSKRSFIRLGKEGIIFALVLIIGLIIILSASDEVTVNLDDYDLAEFANVSYILGNTIHLYDSDENLTTDGTTDFENEIYQFHNYFQIYRTYVNQEDVEDSLDFIELDNHEYQYQLSYEVENHEYILYFSQFGTGINAELHFKDFIYEFEGALSEQEEETAFDLYYSNDEYFASVSSSEYLAGENESVYLIDTWIENKQAASRLTVYRDQYETSIKVDDDDNTYNISRAATVYIVDYSVSNQTGTVEIEDSIDANGVVYNYSIVEAGESVEMHLSDIN